MPIIKRKRKIPDLYTIIFKEKTQNEEIYSTGNINLKTYKIFKPKIVTIKGKKIKSYPRDMELLTYKVHIPEERIILKPNRIYKLTIDYPLSQPYIKEIKTKSSGINLRELVDIIVETYRKIYQKEFETSKLKPETIKERSKGRSLLMNRAKTNGKHGIYGHNLEDLDLHTIFVNKNNIYLGIDS